MYSCFYGGLTLLSLFLGVSFFYFFLSLSDSFVLVGHLFWCNHDRVTDNACDDDTNNFGYTSPIHKYRTIMSKSCQSCPPPHNIMDDKDSDSTTTTTSQCPRVARFSSPHTVYQDESLGSPRHDNVRRLNDKRIEVCQYYPHTCRDSNGNVIAVGGHNDDNDGSSVAKESNQTASGRNTPPRTNETTTTSESSLQKQQNINTIALIVVVVCGLGILIGCIRLIMSRMVLEFGNDTSKSSRKKTTATKSSGAPTPPQRPRRYPPQEEQEDSTENSFW
jgi:hypothetical protein